MISHPMSHVLAGDPPPKPALTIHAPRPMTPAVIARSLDERRTEIIVVGATGTELDDAVAAIRENLERWAAVVRALEAWPVGHPDAPSGYLVDGLAIVDVPRMLGSVGKRPMSWGGNLGRVIEGRW